MGGFLLNSFHDSYSFFPHSVYLLYWPSMFSIGLKLNPKEVLKYFHSKSRWICKEAQAAQFTIFFFLDLKKIWHMTYHSTVVLALAFQHLVLPQDFNWRQDEESWKGDCSGEAVWLTTPWRGWKRGAVWGEGGGKLKRMAQTAKIGMFKWTCLGSSLKVDRNVGLICLIQCLLDF